MLSGIEISQKVSAGRIQIDPFIVDHCGPNSYDIRLGSELHEIIPNTGDFIDTREHGETRKIHATDGAFWLYPGKCYLGHTIEVIGSDVYVSFVHGRSSLARLGVMIHVTAGLIDTGFHGQIVLEIVNTNSCPVVLYSGDRIGQITFQQVNGDMKLYRSGYQGQRGIRPSKGVL